MGQALCRGLISSGEYAPREIVAADVDKKRLAAFAEETEIETAGSVEAAASSNAILLAVKPNSIRGVLEEIAGYIRAEQLVISIAAGITIDFVGSMLRSGVPVIRVMPNTPSLVGAGAAAISRGKYAKDNHVEKVVGIFNAVGKVIEVPEKLLDAVTGLSGSGPGYIYTVIETLTDAGVKEGLPRQQAALLAAQTVYGSAKMVLETGKHPAELRDAVTSPGGTTIAGIAELEKSGLRAALFNAVEAATNRSKQQGDNNH